MKLKKWYLKEEEQQDEELDLLYNEIRCRGRGRNSRHDRGKE